MRIQNFIQLSVRRIDYTQGKVFPCITNEFNKTTVGYAVVVCHILRHWVPSQYKDRISMYDGVFILGLSPGSSIWIEVYAFQFNIKLYGISCWQCSTCYLLLKGMSHWQKLLGLLHSQKARFMGPTWGPHGPMLAPWTFLSGISAFYTSQVTAAHWRSETSSFHIRAIFKCIERFHYRYMAGYQDSSPINSWWGISSVQFYIMNPLIYQLLGLT